MKKICFVLSFVIICCFAASFSVCAESVYKREDSGVSPDGTSWSVTETITFESPELEKAVLEQDPFQLINFSQVSGHEIGTQSIGSSGKSRTQSLGPSDKIGTYRINPETGEKEYLMFWTYAACMSYMGNEEYCASGAHCYHQ